MAFNGSGTFVRLYNWATDAVNGIFVRSDRMDAETDGIATGLSTCITKDGQTTITANIPMSGFKFTGLGLGTSSADAAAVQNANVLNMCEFRLTLTTLTPVTTADVTAAGTIFVSPYRGNRIALYDGTNWNMRSSAEMSIAVPAATSTMHDVFCYDNAGTPTLEVLAWTNDTTRATALVLQNGVLVKSGATTRRFLGSFRTTTVANQTEDSKANRYLINYYNRVRRQMRAFIDATGYTYTTATIRQARGSTANQLNFCVAVAEDEVVAQVFGSVANTNVGVAVQSGIGLDSTTVVSADAAYTDGNATLVANQQQGIGSAYSGYPAAGKHSLVWLEFSAATGTSTWNLNARLCIQGEIWG